MANEITNEKIIDIVHAATHEVFETMLGLKLEQGRMPKRKRPAESGQKAFWR